MSIKLPGLDQVSVVGCIHLSQAQQVDATAARYYSDLPTGAITLLCIDPLQLQQLGLEVRLEPAEASTERFPHLYGALPLDAVVGTEVYVSP